MLPSLAFNFFNTQGNTLPGKAKKCCVAFSYKPDPPELCMAAPADVGKLRHGGIVLPVFSGAVGAEPRVKRV